MQELSIKYIRMVTTDKLYIILFYYFLLHLLVEWSNI
jgi:hypothetical protein